MGCQEGEGGGTGRATLSTLGLTLKGYWTNYVTNYMQSSSRAAAVHRHHPRGSQELSETV